MRNAAVVLALLVLPGCRTQLLDSPELAVTDAGATDAAVCATDYELVAVPLRTIASLDEPPTANAALRVLVSFPWRPACDLLASVDVDPHLDSGPNILITAHIWRSPSTTCTTVDEATAVVDLSVVQKGGDIEVADGAPGGTLTFGLMTNSAAPGSSCAAVALGTPCARSCQCQGIDGRAACIPTQSATSGNVGVCAVSCTEDAACPDEAPACGGASASPPYTCNTTSVCASDTDCPFNQTCQLVGKTHACRTMPMVPVYGAPCACGSDCDDTSICSTTGNCAQPCSIEEDCPDEGLHACLEGVCTPIVP